MPSKYVLEQEFGAGGMGKVFRARLIGEAGFERPVVMKKLLDAKDVGGGQVLIDELTALIGQIAIGTDANADGQTGWQSGEGGLRQANTHMRLMMKGEGL